MRAKEFLLEYDRSREQQRIESLPAYPERLRQDPSFSLEKLESADPTTQKTYVPRLATWWMRGAKIEDLISRGADNLEKFAQLKQKNLLKPEHKDINLFKQFADFEDVLSSYQLPAHPEEKQDRGKYKEIYRDDELLVVELLDETAAKFWGQGTRWCTAAKNNNMFSMYENEGPLFVIIPRKDPDNKYQLWWPEEYSKGYSNEYQFMDDQDEEVNPMDLPIFGKLQQIFGSLHNHIMWKKNPSVAEQVAAVQDDYLNISYIKNPSEKAQLAAIKEDTIAIAYIKNPSENAQLAAIKDNGDMLRYIKKPSEAVQLAAVRQNGGAIEHIKKPSEAVQLAAVQRTGSAIRYIKKPSETVQLATVQRNGRAIQYIKNPSEAVQLAAVTQNGSAIQFIKKPSEAVQLAAVRQDSRVIRYIENPTPKVKALANK